ncbi:MAG: hypothetical protein JO072_09875 [Parafilimonas sp.]|nr:hypothetical protein [Parafilimonas sp.]
MKKNIFIILFFLFTSTYSFSQGCIPIRSITGFGQYNFTDNAYSTSEWQLNFTNRYFKSFRDFSDKNDLHTPPENESVNKIYTLDISIDKLFKNGWSLAAEFPITAAQRTSSIEHGGFNTPRHTTHAFGMGDLRVTAYKWLLLPLPNQKFNIQLGIGLKFPTGDYKVQDYFYRNDTTKVLSAVNPSIQLGDGGTGIITDFNTFYVINKTVSLYGDFYYLINPKNQNGTLYDFGKDPTPLQLQANAVNTSVPDFFSLHAGVNFNMKNLSLSAAIRDEGSPVHDLIGESDGARRAGHYFSVEPGIVYKMKRTTLFGYVPIFIARNLKQTVPDKNITKITGVYKPSPGGSANYMIIAGISFKL